MPIRVVPVLAEPGGRFAAYWPAIAGRQTGVAVQRAVQRAVQG